MAHKKKCDAINDDERVAVGYEANHGAERLGSTAEPNIRTETPDSQENGRLIDASQATAPPPTELTAGTEVTASQSLSDDQQTSSAEPATPPEDRISVHDDHNRGRKISEPDGASADPLDELMTRAISKRRGRPAAFDEHNKGKLVALLSLGMSLRQAAAVLGVAHSTIASTLKADPALAEEITAARFQAQLQPLACVIREARRSWKAATWLLKYLDAKMASHEETPDERRERIHRQNDECVARAFSRASKTSRESA